MKINPSDLLATEGTQEDLRTRIGKLQSAARLLEQSIKAQQEVARSVENQNELYPVAIRIIEGLSDSYAQTLLQAALLDMQLLFGSELQVAMWLTHAANQLRALTVGNTLPASAVVVSQPSMSEANGGNANGTTVAEPESETDDKPDDDDKNYLN